MADYAKLKNADLEALLKERNLPTGGKKADMVDRLKKDDEKKTADKGEDEIDWDDDDAEPSKPAEPESKPAQSVSATPANATAEAAKATTEPAVSAIKAGGQGVVDNPQAVPNQIPDIDPAKTDDLSVKASNEQTDQAKAEEKKIEQPPVDFSRGLAATKLEDEIEKRKVRARKFGLDIDKDETLKKLERALKFGESAPPKGLDEALPQERRKRGRDADDDNGRNKRRGGGGGGGRSDGRGRGNRDGNRRRDNRSGQNGRARSPNKPGSYMSEADKAKAEARKKRFAAPAAST